METKIFVNPSDEELDIAADLLRKGNLVAFPTETVYGLGGVFCNDKAHEAIYEVKGRPKDNPLIVHISDLSFAYKLAVEIPPLFEKIAGAFFPGPLTVILKKHPSIPKQYCCNLETIAIRMPSNLIASKLIAKVGYPLIAPSANLSGKPSPTSAFDVQEDLLHKIPLILDGGLCNIGIESTVISLLDNNPKLLRPGMISKEAIEEVLGISLSTYAGSEILSPGTKYRHYSPLTKIYLCETMQELKERSSLERKPMVLSYLGEDPEYTAFDSTNLYSLFRTADRKAYSSIFIYKSNKLTQDAALMNRISKALS